MTEFVSLDDYLETVGSRAWGFGGNGMNCLFLVGQWLAAQTGIDRITPHLRQFRNAKQADVFLTEQGGALAFMDREVSLCGARRADAPEFGDVGLIEVPIEANGIVTPRLIGAICYGPMWVMREEAGLVYVADLTPAVAWTLSKV